MIALDTNILVYAHQRRSSLHERARRCVADLAAGQAPWALPWSVVHEFLAVMSHPRIQTEPMPLARAADSIGLLLASPSVTLLSEPAGYWEAFCGLTAEAGVTGPLVHDARIAATCLSHGVRELWTADRDFGRFPALQTRNPLVA